MISILQIPQFTPFLPGGTKMYRQYHQRAKNSNFSDFDHIFSFGYEMGSYAKNYKNLLSSLFLGINGLQCASEELHVLFEGVLFDIHVLLK